MNSEQPQQLSVEPNETHVQPEPTLLAMPSAPDKPKKVNPMDTSRNFSIQPAYTGKPDKSEPDQPQDSSSPKPQPKTEQKISPLRLGLENVFNRLPKPIAEPLKTLERIYLGTPSEKAQTFQPVLARAQAKGRISETQSERFEQEILQGNEGLTLLVQDTLGAAALGWIVGKPVVGVVALTTAYFGHPEVGIAYAAYDALTNPVAAIYFLGRTVQEIQHAKTQIETEGGSQIKQKLKLGLRIGYSVAMNVMSITPGLSMITGPLFTLPRQNGGLNLVLLRELPDLVLDPMKALFARSRKH